MMKNLIEKVANRVVDGDNTHWEMNIHHFDWIPGVGLYGIYKAYKATNNRKYYDFLIDWTQRHLKEAYDNNTVNSTAPLMTVADLYKERKDPAYRKVMTEIAEYIITKAPLTKEGGLEYTVTEWMGQEGFRHQIWRDTLFMCCLFLAKLGKITGEKKIFGFLQLISFSFITNV